MHNTHGIPWYSSWSLTISDTQTIKILSSFRELFTEVARKRSFAVVIMRKYINFSSQLFLPGRRGLSLPRGVWDEIQTSVS